MEQGEIVNAPQSYFFANARKERVLRPEVQAALNALETTAKDRQANDHESIYGLANLAVIYRALGRDVDADPLFNHVCDLITQFDIASESIFVLLLLHGKEAEAKNRIDRLLDSIDPNKPSISNPEYHTAFHAYLEAERYADALGVMQRWPKNLVWFNRPDKNRDHAYTLLARELARGGENLQSRSIAEGSIYPGNAWARVAQGAAAGGHLDDAVFALRKAKESTYKGSWWNDLIVDAHVELGQIEEARSFIEAQGEEFRIGRAREAYLHADKGEFQKAIQCADDFVRDMKHENPYLNLSRLRILTYVAELQFKVGQGRAAHDLLRSVWLEAVTGENDQYALREVASTFASVGLLEEAIAAYADLYELFIGIDKPPMWYAEIGAPDDWKVIVAEAIVAQAKVDLAFTSR